MFNYIVTFLIAVSSYLLFYVHRHQRNQAATVRAHGCSPITKHRSKDPFFALDFELNMLKDVVYLFQYHRKIGHTFADHPLLTSPSILTIAPQNIKAINGGKEWGVEGMRLAGMEYFCGTGFLTTDGDLWHHSRKLLKPSFAKKNLENLQHLAKQVDHFFLRLPADGETVDLQPHFYGIVSCFA